MALKSKLKEHHNTHDTIPSVANAISVDENLCVELCFPLIYRNEEYFKIACKIYDSFLEKLNINGQLTEKMIREVVVKHISTFNVPKHSIKTEIVDFVIDNLLYYGPISTIIRISGSNLNDIIVNTKDYVDVIYDGQTLTTPFKFRSEEDLKKFINRMLSESNRKVDESHPIASAKLPDGSRIEIQIPPVSANIDSDGNAGSYVTVRKFREVPLLFETLIDSNMIDYKMAYFLFLQ